MPEAYRDAFHSPWAGLANATVTNQYTPAYLSPSRFLGYPEINQTWKIGNFPPANQSDDELYACARVVCARAWPARVRGSCVRGSCVRGWCGILSLTMGCIPRTMGGLVL